ncbi:HI0074 family nucleotidyltransferase substrate-binding subunit [Peredibacter sp. HCB2-198]|uniref:HI0074 family nucleotidyltransferase substrate-binding subunit n=1 Tax=Peredibacter sp. HCB2-198 TaxID=3383025 RepID=UPI0038B51F38
MSAIVLTRLVKALESLKNGYKEKPSELERDGLIQRFEYTLELCWKTSKKILLFNGIDVDTPKNVIREMGSLGWISNPEKWIDYIEKRNEKSHIYNEEIAIKIFNVIKDFIVDADTLLKVLEEKNK